jgi:hypothetical protein
MNPMRMNHRPAQAAPPGEACVQALAGEHGALTRQLAVLQCRVSDQLADYAGRVRWLEAEVVRLRGRLVQSRTALLWGLDQGGLPQARPSAHTMAAERPRSVPKATAVHTQAMPESSAVICQTGCSGHAHPWLEADGQCRRTGGACDGPVSGPRISRS